jgi:Pentapeptide repeats (8 copies)
VADFLAPAHMRCHDHDDGVLTSVVVIAENRRPSMGRDLHRGVWGTFGLVVALVAALSAALLAGPAAALVKPRVQHVSLLYVVNADSGTLRPLPGRRFVLTLNRLERHGVWFSDRPARRSGAFPARLLGAGWMGLGFVSQPPNAALVYSPNPDRAGSTIILRLGRPRYTQRGNALSFAAKWIDPSTVRSPNLVGRARNASASVPRRFGNASLFIDDGTAPLLTHCIIQPFTQCAGDDLHGAALQGQDLEYADFAGANLNEATLAGANLSFATLGKARLQIASLAGANLTDASLAFADMPGANLGGANLTGASLFDAFDTGANYGGATFCHTTLPNGMTNNTNC